MAVAAANGNHCHLPRYVELSKDQDNAPPADEVRPRDLNLAVRRPELARWSLEPELRKCGVCGQQLPEGHEVSVPADKPWTTGIFGYAEDPKSCWTGLLCPCVLFGRNAEAILGAPWMGMGVCTCHAVCIEGGIALAILIAACEIVAPAPAVTCVLIAQELICCWMLSAIFTAHARHELQKKYHLKDSPCNPCLVHCCLHCCANCQEHRERNGRLAEQAVPTTVVNQPLVQKMSMTENHPLAKAPENEAPNTGDNVEVCRPINMQAYLGWHSL